MLDGIKRVTGAIDLTSNFSMPGMLHAAVLRSVHSHALIKHIDTQGAWETEGVFAVLTGADLEHDDSIETHFGPVLRDQPILAIGKVRFVGEPVVAVAATTYAQAQRAVARITVEYEPLPAVYEPLAATESTAPILHEESNRTGPTFTDIRIVQSAIPNVCNVFHLLRGQPEESLRSAYRVYDHTFSSPAVQHVAMETHACVINYQDDLVECHTTTQTPYMIRSQLAEILHKPEATVRIISRSIGGAYGSKNYPIIEPIAAVLSRAANRPVRYRLTREEEFVSLSKHAVTIRMTTGVNEHGKIVARKVACYFNTGAYADIGPRLIKNGGFAMNGPYSIDNVEIDSYAVYTNTPPAGAFRGYGVSQAVWAYESQIDMIAEDMSLDPRRLRLDNILEDGDSFATGEVMHDLHYQDLINNAWDALRKPEYWKDQLPPTLHIGSGIACALKSTVTPSTSTVFVKVNPDGSANILSSSVEMGQGVQTTLAIIAANFLSVKLSDVSVATVDTAVTPYDQQTSSSRSTYSMGNALRAALDDITSQLVHLASQQSEIPADHLSYAEGRLQSDDGRYSATVAEIVSRSNQGNILGRGTFQTTGGLDEETGQGVASAHWHQAIGAATVAVDMDTGKISVLDYVAGTYAGRVVNKTTAELQMHGNVAMGLGQAFWEEMVFDAGQLQNGTMADYVIPGSTDRPLRTVVQLLESSNPDAELHGVGETALPPVMAAIANALANATGVRVTELPLTAERVLDAIDARREERAGAAAMNATATDTGSRNSHV